MGIKKLKVFFVLLLFVVSFSIKSQVYINEFQASNSVTIQDEFNEYDDWVEIYNAGTEPINLATYYLTDDILIPNKWKISSVNSALTTILPDSFIVFWCDNDILQGINHIGFKLSSGGEQLALFSPSLQLIDSISFLSQVSDISYGRTTDGSSTWSYFPSSTPNTSNISTAFSGFVTENPVFSITGGFYASSQILTISHNSGVLRYTTDGSDVDTSSDIYSSSINIDTTMVVRAKLYVDGLIEGKTTTHSYFINESFDTRGLPVVSISTKPDNLWDSQTGIYVQHFHPTWEYPIHVEMFENDGTLAFSENAGIKILGLNSWQLPQKMLGIYFRSQYNANPINYKLFPDRQRNYFKSFTLRASGSDWSHTLFSDGLQQKLLEKTMGLDIQGFRPCVVYFNGKYMGIHNIRDKMNDDYFAEYYRVNEIDLIENHGSVEAGDTIDYMNMFNYFSSTNFASTFNYNHAKEVIDIESCMNYYIGTCFLANTSWGHNMLRWKPKIENQKWKWLNVDLDRGFRLYRLDMLSLLTEWSSGNYNPYWGTLHLRRLLENDEFEKMFLSKFSDYIYVNFNEQYLLPLIDSFKSSIEAEMPRHIARWQGTTSSYGNAISSVSAWNSEVNTLKKFAKHRADTVLFRLNEFFSLNGISPMLLNIENSEAGKILMNNIVIPKETWSGYYLNDFSITLKAIPNDGYIFVKWEGVDSGNATSSEITFTITDSLNITAIFEIDTNSITDIVINEINYDYTLVKNVGDWIELYNNGSQVADLSNWYFKDKNDSNIFTFPENTILNNDSYLIICSDKFGFQQIYEDEMQLIGNFSFGLSNTGDDVRLYDSNGLLKDYVSYTIVPTWPNISDNKDLSIELKNPDLDNNVGTNWIATFDSLGTPSEINSSMENQMYDIPNQAVMSGSYFADINLNNYLYLPNNNYNDVNWTVTGNSNINVSIQNNIAHLTYFDWSGTENLVFTVTIDGAIYSDTAMFLSGTLINNDIFCDAHFTMSNSPYFLQRTLIIEAACSLTVDAGVDIFVNENSSIIVKGNIKMNGTDLRNINISAFKNHWGVIFLNNAKDSCIFEYVSISDATYGLDYVLQNAAISANHSSLIINHLKFKNNLRCVYSLYSNLSVRNSIFYENNFGEKVNSQFSVSSVEHSIFYNTVGDNDAVDFDAVNVGNISYNKIYGGDDDGIDIGQSLGIACNGVVINNNIVKDIADKAISIGEGSKDIYINNNLLINSSTGIAVKDSSNIFSDHNTISNNKNNITCYEKNLGFGGGIAEVSNSILSFPIENSFIVDSVSAIYFTYTLSTEEVILGEGNIYGDPQFVDLENVDYHLKENSPCIDAGNPNFTLNLDSSITDVGAFQFGEVENIVQVNNSVFKIFSNPVKDFLNIEIQNSVISNLYIFDANGKLLLSNKYNKSNISINVSTLSSGIYQLKFFVNTKGYVTKFVKN